MIWKNQCTSINCKGCSVNNNSYQLFFKKSNKKARTILSKGQFQKVILGILVKENVWLSSEKIRDICLHLAPPSVMIMSQISKYLFLNLVHFSCLLCISVPFHIRVCHMMDLINSIGKSWHSLRFLFSKGSHIRPIKRPSSGKLICTKGSITILILSSFLFSDSQTFWSIKTVDLTNGFIKPNRFLKSYTSDCTVASNSGHPIIVTSIWTF